MPILEPEVTISIEDKAEAEDLLLKAITKELKAIPAGKEMAEA